MQQINRTSRIGRQYRPTTGDNLKDNDIAIINRIAGEFQDLSRRNIQDWRRAMEAAYHYLTPNWQPIQDIYDYLSPDAHLGSQIDIRKGVVKAAKYYIRSKKTGKENDDKTGKLETEWFYNLLSDLLDADLYKVTAAQVRDVVKGKYDLLPRRNIVPQQDLILFETYGETGVALDDPAFKDTVIYVKSTHKYGIMNDIVPDLIWKKNARQSWASFSEKFGHPLLTATTTKTSKTDIDRIEYMLKKMGEATRAVFPEGTTIDVKNEAKAGDPYNVFLKQMEYSDQQISKRLVGGTMVSDNGSSKSQAEVHAGTLNFIIGKEGRKRLGFAINDKLIHTELGKQLGFTDDDEFVFDESEELSLLDHWKIVNEATAAGYEIEVQWISETFNIPIVGKKSPPVFPGLPVPETPPAPEDEPEPEAEPEPDKQPQAKAKRFFD